jgi:hypothetical protein
VVRLDFHLLAAAEPQYRVRGDDRAVGQEGVGVAEGDEREAHAGDLMALLDLAAAGDVEDDRAGVGRPFFPGAAFRAPCFEHQIPARAERGADGLGAQTKPPRPRKDCAGELIGRPWPVTTTGHDNRSRARCCSAGPGRPLQVSPDVQRYEPVVQRAAADQIEVVDGGAEQVAGMPVSGRSSRFPTGNRRGTDDFTDVAAYSAKGQA